MKVLITGAGGFVGQALAESLLNDEHSVILTDLHAPPIPPRASNKHLATSLGADLRQDPSPVLSPDLDAIYVFHGIMSSGSEANLELGYSVNLMSTIQLLDTVRKTCKPGIRIIYASSCATFGQPLPTIPSEATVQTPEGSYGTQKAMMELMVNDYTRRGIITGFTVRLPSICVREGPPTQAASAWMSSVISGPLQGREAVLPCPDDFECWLSSPRTLVTNLKMCLTLPKDCMPPHIRQVMLPGITATVSEMMSALKQVGGQKAVDLVKRQDPDPATKALLESWPVRFDVSKALGIGFVRDEQFLTAVQDFAETLKE